MIELTQDTYSTADISKLFGISRATLERYRAAGVMQATKIGQRKVLYARNEVAKLLKPVVPRSQPKANH